MKNTIRIGIVGAGANTRALHIPGFQKIEGVEVVSVANRSIESSQAVASEFSIPNVYDNPYDLIDADDTDAICIGTWPYTHKPFVLAALDANKHVLTEARLAMNASDAHQILYASRLKPNLVTQVVPGPLSYPADQTIIDLVTEDFFGDILSVELTISAFGAHEGQPGTFINPDLPFMWRHDRDLNGLNTMLMGVWYEAIERWLGPASSVTAVTRTNVKMRNDPNSGKKRAVAPPDLVEILAEMYSGPVLHMRISEVTGLGPSAAWIFGSKGTLHYDIQHQRVETATKNDTELTVLDIPKEKQAFWRVEAEFVGAIRGEEKVHRHTFEDGVHYMEFTEAVYRSSQSGKTVYLPL